MPRGDYTDAINNAGIVLQELGRTGEAIDLYRRLLERMPAQADACNNMGTALLAEGRPDEARAAFERAFVQKPDFPEAFYNLGNACRELGNLSGDFNQQATAQLMAELFECHDRDRFEVFAYSYGPDDNSPMRARLTRAFDRFADVRGLSHREAARLIHVDKVDILVDLKGYTYHPRPQILPYRPPPLQYTSPTYPP